MARTCGARFMSTSNDDDEPKGRNEKPLTVAEFDERMRYIGERNKKDGIVGRYAASLLTALYARTMSGKLLDKATVVNRDRTPPPKRPLAFTGTIGKYTHALFSDASKTGQLEVVERELKRLVAEFESSNKLRDAILSPIASKDSKLVSGRELARKAKSSELVYNLFERLVTENRVRDLKTLASNFSRLLAESKGQVPAIVYSAETLSTEQIQRIEGKIGKLLEPGQKLVLSAQVNPKLLGGLKIRLGDRELDLSVASKIQSFNTALRTSLFG
jgi:ATP synthase F1 delta subunit